jgi:hypothetical protein
MQQQPAIMNEGEEDTITKHKKATTHSFLLVQKGKSKIGGKMRLTRAKRKRNKMSCKSCEIEAKNKKHQILFTISMNFEWIPWDLRFTDLRIYE